MATVFLSYRNDSNTHAQAVRQLGQLLRNAGIPVTLDQFFLDENPGGSDLGWPKWCEKHAQEAEAVLVVASTGWFDVWEDKAVSEAGLGSAFEAAVMRQYLYDQRAVNSRIRLVFLHDMTWSEIPPLLRPWQKFFPFKSPAQLTLLMRWLGERLGVKPAAVKWPPALPFESQLADRSRDEWPAVVDLLTGASARRILLFRGGSGLGKSMLIAQAEQYAAHLGLPVVHIDFKGGQTDVAAIYERFAEDAGAHLQSFTSDRGNSWDALRQDLRALRAPLLVVCDHYEHAAGNASVESWLQQQFLPEVAASLGLSVIVAGQEIPTMQGRPWNALARYLPLKPIDSVEDWQAWFDRNHPDYRDRGFDLAQMVSASGGNPAIMATLASPLAAS